MCYLRAERRGTSVGRNRGLFAARTRLVVFTDDDTEVDRAWVGRMAGAVGYEPSAFLWHHHRTDDDTMRAQLRGYAVGLSALLTKIALDPGARRAALRRLPAALQQARTISERETEAGYGMPDDAAALRLRGTVAGPAAYLRARRAVLRDGGRVPPLTPPGRMTPGWVPSLREGGARP